MKKLFLILIGLACLTPFLAFADAGGAGQGVIDNGYASCQVFTCKCSLNHEYKESVYGTTSQADCDAQCVDTVKDYNAGYADPENTTSEFTCSSTSTTAATTTPVREPVLPCFNVPIPGLSFGNCDPLTAKDPNADDGLVTLSTNNQESNLLGTYVEAVYAYLLGAGTLVAVTMLMIAGIQYATARGDSKQVEAAKKRIGNAVAGVILLLLAYNIAFLIDPAATQFDALALENIQGLTLDREATGPEGSGSIIGATGTWENLSSPYLDLVQKSKAQAGTCKITDGLASPTGTLPNQGPHHWSEGLSSGDFTKVTNLDWAASWGSDIKAPFSGTVSYAQQTNADNKCGNRIYLKAPTGEQITICHAKDFLNGENEFAPGQVTQGQVIGHLGGRCCAGGGSVPSGWVTECTASGTSCTDPAVGGDCDCQPIAQSGNTTGPHVHISMTSGQSNILSCLK